MQLLPRPQKSAPPPRFKATPAPEEMALPPAQGAEGRVPLERVIVLIDGANLFYAAGQLGVEVDYTRLLQCLTGGRSLIRAYFYTGVDSTNRKQQNFLMWMRHHGYRVVSKELMQYADGSKKANLEIEMAIDMLKLADYYDTLVLLSGNGDLSYAVNRLAYQGVQIEVVSLPSMLNDSLRDVADRFIDLTTLKTKIQRDSLHTG